MAALLSWEGGNVRGGQCPGGNVLHSAESCCGPLGAGKEIPVWRMMPSKELQLEPEEKAAGPGLHGWIKSETDRNGIAASG